MTVGQAIDVLLNQLVKVHSVSLKKLFQKLNPKSERANA